MGCGCGKDKTPTVTTLEVYRSEVTGGDMVSVAARSSIKIVTLEVSTVLRAGSSMELPENTAIDLIAQGAPIWIF